MRYDILKIMVFPYIFCVKRHHLTPHIENASRFLTHDLFIETWDSFCRHPYIATYTNSKIFRLLGATVMFVHETIRIMKLQIYTVAMIVINCVHAYNHIYDVQQ